MTFSGAIIFWNFFDSLLWWNNFYKYFMLYAARQVRANPPWPHCGRARAENAILLTQMEIAITFSPYTQPDLDLRRQ
jgi:hypothetical protein